MRKTLTILAACGLALGAAACGKHDDGNSGANMSSSDNMLVPSDENAADAGMGNDAGANAAGGADNGTAAMGNDMGAGTAGGTGAAGMSGGATGGSSVGSAGGTGSGASSGGQ